MDAHGWSPGLRPGDPVDGSLTKMEKDGVIRSRLTPLLALFLVMLYFLPRGETVIAAIIGAMVGLYVVVFASFGGLYVKMKKRFGG